MLAKIYHEIGSIKGVINSERGEFLVADYYPGMALA